MDKYYVFVVLEYKQIKFKSVNLFNIPFSFYGSVSQKKKKKEWGQNFY